MKINRAFYGILILVMIALSSCTEQKIAEPSLNVQDSGYMPPMSSAQVNIPEEESRIIKELHKNPLKPPESLKGNASISGVLFSYTTGITIGGTAFYLSPATGSEEENVPKTFVGPLKENGDIEGRTEDNGNVFLSDIPPGNYYLVVWAPYNWNIAETAEKNLTPLLIKLEQDEKLELGVIYVSWP